jgi:internalin A
MAAGVDDAIAAVERLGGWVTRDGERVSEVKLNDTPTADDDLRRIAALVTADVLDLFATQVTGPGLAALTGWDRLTTLYLTHTPLTDEGLGHLPELPSLETLILDFTQIGDTGLQHLPRWPRLQEINLIGTHCTDAGLAALSRCRMLRRLYWSCPGITEDGVAELSRQLPGLYANGYDLELHRPVAPRRS